MKIKLFTLALLTAAALITPGCTTGLAKVVRELKNDPAMVHFSFQGWGASVVLDRSGQTTNTIAR